MNKLKVPQNRRSLCILSDNMKKKKKKKKSAKAGHFVSFQNFMIKSQRQNTVFQTDI